MFGQNPIRHNETHQPGEVLAVQEVFYTLQGEGPYSGRAAVFIRLAGCNLACSFCDTEFESGINNRLSVKQIVDKVKMLPRRDFVVITGGEPMRQNILPLINELVMAGVQLIQIETAGTLWVPGLESFMHRSVGRVELVCSPKTPNIHSLVKLYCEHYKYVVKAGQLDPADGLPSYGTQGRNATLQQRIFRPWEDRNIANAVSQGLAHFTVWVSPCDEHEEMQGAEGKVHTRANIDAAVQVALTHGYRLSLQTHKIVNLP